MSLSLTNLYKSMVRQFNTVTSDTRFQEDFRDAVNLCLDELSFGSQMSTAMSHIESYQDTVSDMDEEHSFILNDGMVVKLVEAGRKHVRGDEAYVLAKGNWAERVGDWMVVQSREDQSDVDDDDVPEDDIVGLGYLGDQ